MATPPTRVSYAQTNFTTNTTPKSTSTFDVQAGDLIVIYGYAAVYETTLNTPTWDGSGSVVLKDLIYTSGYAPICCWTISVTATATGRSITGTISNTTFVWGLSATVWRNHGGIGVASKANTSGTPSVALTTTAANSAVQTAINDWNGVNGSSRAWLSVNGSAMTESMYTYVTDAGIGYYTIYESYRADTGSTGSKTLGLSAPSGQKYSIIGVEILPASSGPAKVSTLTEPFNTLDTSKWDYVDGDGTLTVTGGELVVALLPSKSGYTYDLYTSKDTYDLTNSELVVEIPGRVNGSQGTEQQLLLMIDNNNLIGLMIDGPFYVMRIITAGSGSDTYYNPYPSNDRWWRIRESAGTIYWESSPDRSNWTILRSTASTFSITALKARLSVGTWQPIASPGTAKFDNINLETPVYRNTAEGQSNGTTLTAANSGSGSGDAFDIVTANGTIARTFSNELAMFGSQSYKVVPSSSSALFCRVNAPATTYSATLQMYLYLPTYADNNQMFMQIRSASAAVTDISINASGQVRIDNAVGGNVITTAAGVFPTGQWVRMDLSATVGTTTSNGRIMVQLSTQNSFTPFWSYDTGYVANTGTAALAEYRFGKLDTVPNIALFYFDNIAWRSNMIAFIPPESSSPGVAWFIA